MKRVVIAFVRLLVEYKAFAYVAAVIVGLSLLRIPLGTFNNNSLIDTVSHFVLPAVLAPLAYAGLRRWVGIPPLGAGATILLVSICGITGETLWEVMEFTIDSSSGTHWQVDNADTMHDVMLAVAGAPVGAWLDNYRRTPAHGGSTALRQADKPL